MNQLLKKWLVDNNINYRSIDQSFFLVQDVGTFYIVKEKDVMFNDSFDLLLEEDEYEVSADYYCFYFGNNWYYTSTSDICKVKLTPLKYIGGYKSTLGVSLPMLGVHGGFDLLNGSRSYKDWCEKAKFLGIDTLGIVEKNTLGGALKFQLACNKANIKPIIGIQLVVRWKEDSCQLKCYVKNEIGWRNLLLIYKEINVLNDGYIERNRLFELTEGLFIVLDPKYISFEATLPFTLNIEELYWQLDSVEFKNDERDKWYLENVQKYIKGSGVNFKPVLICDAYYLEKEDSDIKTILNNISDKRDFASFNQHFKTIDEVFLEFIDLFSTEDDCFELFEKSIENTFYLAENCTFKINIEGKHLPEYKMCQEQSLEYSSNRDLFYGLLESAIERKLQDVENIDIYLDRLQEECRVIEKGGFIDYFLILWDIGEFCKSQNILRGIGRGSAGGSLTAYLLEITHIDPLKYGLLFERFLNEGRIGKSLPDIDTDFPSEYRDQVKHYMESKYGIDQVCSVGTYTTLKIKAALKDLGRQFQVEIPTLNYINKIIPDDSSFTDLFHLASEKSAVKNFILNYPELVEWIPFILGQPRSKSIHACATLILPDEKSIYEWIPVRSEIKDGISMLVSDWEGPELEIAGFLKEDILGIEQLSKFTAILRLVKMHKNIDIDIYTIPLDDEKVYEYFCAGWNSDVFHFGSKGLTTYCKDLQPRCIEDLIAGIALYRPGAMESNFHNEYVLRKNGKREIEYIPGTEAITEETYGLCCYQEQVMQICRTIGGFSAIEADDIRKAMGKKVQSLLDSYKDKFIQGGVCQGYDKGSLESTWGMLERFGAYGFNKSHATAYAITGYISQWLKVHYPLEFWSTALERANEEELSRYIAEIYDSNSNISLDPPDINTSRVGFSTDFDKRKILWSLDKVKQCGIETVEKILNERKANGIFFSLREFLERIPKGDVDKRVVEHLILSGSFDEIECVKKPGQRAVLLETFYIHRNIKEKTITTEKYPNSIYDWWWTLQQKNISGYGYFDFKQIKRSILDLDCSLVSVEELLQKDIPDRMERLLIGVVKEIVIKNSKKGEFAQVLLDCNYVNVWVIFWSEIWQSIKENIIDSKSKILAVNGSLMYDSWRKQNIIQTEENTKIYLFS